MNASRKSIDPDPGGRSPSSAPVRGPVSYGLPPGAPHADPRERRSVQVPAGQGLGHGPRGGSGLLAAVHGRARPHPSQPAPPRRAARRARGSDARGVSRPPRLVATLRSDPQPAALFIRHRVSNRGGPPAQAGPRSAVRHRGLPRRPRRPRWTPAELAGPSHGPGRPGSRAAAAPGGPHHARARRRPRRRSPPRAGRRGRSARRSRSARCTGWCSRT